MPAKIRLAKAAICAVLHMNGFVTIMQNSLLYMANCGPCGHKESILLLTVHKSIMHSSTALAQDLMILEVDWGKGQTFIFSEVWRIHARTNTIPWYDLARQPSNAADVPIQQK